MSEDKRPGLSITYLDAAVLAIGVFIVLLLVFYNLTQEVETLKASNQNKSNSINEMLRISNVRSRELSEAKERLVRLDDSWTNLASEYKEHLKKCQKKTAPTPRCCCTKQ